MRRKFRQAHTMRVLLSSVVAFAIAGPVTPSTTRADVCDGQLTQLTPPYTPSVDENILFVPTIIHVMFPPLGDPWYFNRSDDQIRLAAERFVRVVNAALRNHATQFNDYPGSIDTRVELFLVDQNLAGFPMDPVHIVRNPAYQFWDQGVHEYQTELQVEPAYFNIWFPRSGVPDPDEDLDEYGWTCRAWAPGSCNTGVVMNWRALTDLIEYGWDMTEARLTMLRAEQVAAVRLIAHALGLLYTFENATSTWACNGTYDCWSTGDLLCDTTPDFPHHRLDQELFVPGTCSTQDQCFGQSIAIDQENFMGDGDQCARRWSPQQAARLRCGITTYHAPLWNGAEPRYLEARGFGGAAKGIAAGDFNNDGGTDLLMVANVDGRVSVRTSALGAGTFAVVADTGDLGGVQDARGALWLHANADDYADVLVVTPGAVRAFEGDGTGAFTEASAAWGLAGVPGGVGAGVTDFDADGFLDLVVLRAGAGTRLYRNAGGQGLVALFEPGLQGVIDATCASWADYDRDGDMDVAFGTATGVRLLERLVGTLVDKTTERGLTGTLPCGSVAWADWNRDGHLDLVAGGSNGCRLWTGGLAGFTDVTSAAGVHSIGPVSDVAWVDENYDGFPDLFAARSEGPDRVYRNEELVVFAQGPRALYDHTTSVLAGPSGGEAQSQCAVLHDTGTFGASQSLLIGNSYQNKSLVAINPTDGHYVRVELRGAPGNPWGLGAKITLTIPPLPPRVEHIPAPTGHTQHYPAVRFSFGALVPVAYNVRVDWPAGGYDELQGINALDTTLYIHQGVNQGWADATHLDPQDLGDDALAASAASFVDFDEDGYPDITIGHSPGPGHPEAASRVLHNDGEGSFTRITLEAPGSAGTANAVLWGDFDNDGDRDLCLLGEPQPFWEQQSDHTLVHRTTTLPPSMRAASLADYDGDGLLDFAGFESSGRPVLYHATAPWTYQNATTIWMTYSLPETSTPRAALWLQYDMDGRLDLMFMADEDNSEPAVFRNTVTGFEAVTPAPFGVVKAGGVLSVDIDNDREDELVFYGDAGVRVFHRYGPVFAEITNGLGLEQVAYLHVLDLAALDINADTYTDLYMLRGFAGVTKSILLTNNAGAAFTRDANFPVLEGAWEDARSVCVGDWDADGDTDMYVTRAEHANLMLQNNLGPGPAWLRSVLRGVATPAGTPTAVTVAVQGTDVAVRTIGRSGRAHSQDELAGTVILPVGTAAVDLRVEWPSGRVSELTNVAVNQTVSVLEPPFVFTNQSVPSGMEYPDATPAGAVVLNVDGTGTAPDLLVVMKGSRAPELFQGMAPIQGEIRLTAAPALYAAGQAPAGPFRAAAVADFDNDGDDDVFLPGFPQVALYRHDPDGLRDVAATYGLTALADSSRSAAWGDINRDGWLDLYVSRSGDGDTPSTIIPARARMLQSLMPDQERFGDVSASVGLDHVWVASTSAAWADIDNDGEVDLVVGEARPSDGGQVSPRTRVYMNDGPGTDGSVHFTEDTVPRLGARIGSVNGIALTDLNGDGSIDLLCSRHAGAGALFPNNLFVRYNSGGYFLTPGDSDGLYSIEAMAGVQIGDFDLNGAPDLLGVPAGAARPVLLSGGLPGTALPYQDVSTLVQLGSTMGAGAMLADLDRDGDPDVYVARPDAPTSPEFLFKCSSSRDAGLAGAHWLGVRLEASTGANNRGGVGAVVTVQATLGGMPHSATQLVSVAGVQGGQGPHCLYFALPGHSGDVIISTRWNDGGVTNLTVPPSGVDTIVTVHDNFGPGLVADSRVGYFEPRGAGTVNWVFVWDSDQLTPAGLDWVYVKAQGKPPQIPGYAYPDVTLHPGSDGVTARVYPIPGGRYRHEVRWPRDCVAPRTYTWRAGSSVGGYGYSESFGSDAVLVVFQCLE